jgi:uncharacterized membrane protein
MSSGAGYSARARTADSARNAALGFGLLGLLIGAFVAESAWGALSGAAFGAGFGVLRAAARRAAALEVALARIEVRLGALENERAPRAGVAVASATAPPAPSIAEGDPLPQPPRLEPTRVEIALSADRPAAPPRGPSAIESAFAAAREFVFGGNTVVRVGILVLLIGVALLAKWAVDHALFPIEARLAAAAAIGLVLTGVGYRLRDARPGFATTLQGGGIAALYLVVFFAYRGYALVPAPLAFALFVAIAIACGVLALVQDSQPLIFIGSIGGFLAPILASTGEGRHVVLFSYYLLLDLAVAAVAWRKAWRALNLLAFFSTYAVATAWGVLAYRPEHFASTEPFVIAYLVLFTGVALVNAWRRPPRLAGIVDGTLVFGTPLLSLLAQGRLVEGKQLGMALSTAALGVYYALLATWVWRRAPETLRRVAEAFVALAIAFATIAIPLAIDDALTTTLVWALEGAGLYWVGARQQRWLARASGVALQALAAIAYAWASQGAAFSMHAWEFALANPRFLSGAAIAAGGLFIAREAYALRDRLIEVEWQLAQALAVWGLAWWAGAWAAEIDQFLPATEAVAAALLVTSATFLALERAAAALAWLPGRLLALALIPTAFVALPVALEREEYLFAGSSAIAWPLLLVAVYVVLRRLEGCGEPRTSWGYAPALWLVALVLGFGMAGVVDVPLALNGDWPIAAFAIGPVLALLAAQQLLERGVGPFWRFPSLHLGAGAAPLAALSVFWFLAINRRAQGDTAPLPYLPLLGPADLALALLLAALVDWWLRVRHTRPPVLPGEWRAVVAPGFAALAFVWLNGVLVRSVVQWAGVPFDGDALWDSTPLQAALSISWTLVALGAMVWCTRRSYRRPWIAAATLLGVTVVKLFAVDLSTLSTGAKIATFLVVGALLLVVGYLSPVPPAVPDATAEPAAPSAGGDAG